MSSASTEVGVPAACGLYRSVLLVTADLRRADSSLLFAPALDAHAGLPSAAVPPNDKTDERRHREENAMANNYADVNNQIINAFRANHGVVGGPFEGKRLVLLHHTGRRSGKEYVTPLVSASDEDAFLICGSLGGSPTDPLWVGNIEAGPGETTIEAGDRTVRVRTTVIRPHSPDWERVFGIWSTYWPAAHEYQKNTSRKFPIVRLEPVA
jgi:deazaflavin-dependent oxidoreductase (nitroreductase family)